MKKIFFMSYACADTHEIGVVEFSDILVANDTKDCYEVSGYSTNLRSYDEDDPVVVELRKHDSYKAIL